MNPLKLLLPSCLLVTTMLVLVDGFYPPLPKIFDPESFVKPHSDCGALVELYGAVKKALDEYCSKTGKHGEWSRYISFRYLEQKVQSIPWDTSHLSFMRHFWWGLGASCQYPRALFQMCAIFRRCGGWRSVCTRGRVWRPGPRCSSRSASPRWPASSTPSTSARTAASASSRLTVSRFRINKIGNLLWLLTVMWPEDKSESVDKD